ncbi:MAG: sigma-54 dependent transcriptional regulator [Candidatus Competibacteraceae bacterium]
MDNRQTAIARIHPSELPVLYIDDEPSLLRSVSTILRSAGIQQVLTLADSRQALPLLIEQDVGALIIDLSMPFLSGQALLERITADYPDIPVIVMTATDDLNTAVNCMKAGAFDYLVKPVEKNRLVASVTRAIEIRGLREEVQSLKERLLSDNLKYWDAFSAIITQHKKMLAIFRYMEAISASRQPVLITGETGTGKELIAAAIHKLSRVGGEFVAVNVAGLDDTVFSDTLFGHKKGAYTGAEQVREGLIAAAGEGTLFLDEIGDLKESSQVKLLRLLQENKYYPLGADYPRSNRARIVVATNCDILQLVSQGRFRKDLFYRLRGHHIHLPPLRERLDDLPLLINHFLEESAQALDKPTPIAPTALYSLLKNYHFPGNVRELEAMIHDAVARHQRGILALASFREAMGYEQLLEGPDGEGEQASLLLNRLFPERLPTLKEAEHYLIEEALRRADGNQGIAAGLLGITRQALNKRLIRGRRQDDDFLEA